MGIVELLLTGVGLAMDAFAVSVCKGLSMKKIRYGHAVVIALFFGGFQALMPFLGWALGTQFKDYIISIDHWIAFVLLAIIGGKMLKEAFSSDKEEVAQECEQGERMNYKELFLLAIATSIDALAVGVTFAFLNVNIYLAIAIIGVVTFLLAFAGVVIGNIFGSRFEKGAQIAGGAILIGIGLKILLEHLGILVL